VPIAWAHAVCWNIYNGKRGKNGCKYVQIIISSSVFHLSFYGMEISELLKRIISDKERRKIRSDISQSLMIQVLITKLYSLLVSMVVKHNNVLLNLIIGCLYWLTTYFGQLHDHHQVYKS